VDTFSELVFLKFLNNNDIKCKKSSTINYRRHAYEHVEKIKINLVQLIVSIFSLFWFLIIYKDFRRFSRIIIEKTTFEEFEEICE